MAKKLKFADDAESRDPGPAKGCQIKTLATSKLIKAAKTATEINPNNAPHARGLSEFLDKADYCDQIQPQRIALLTSKYWGAGGVKLGVSFMETTVQQLRDLIISHMNAWGDYANVQFAYSQSNGDVRISRGPGGYWSYLGTDILHIPKGQQTMNLEGFTLKTPLSEYMRVVRHETGHTLGFPHEHMRREIVSLLDPAKTIAYFEKTQDWSQDEVEQQVLTPLEDALLKMTTADVQSIMCYQLPGSITKNGQPIPGGIDIDPQDGKFAALIYPKASNPVDPTGGGGVVQIGQVLVDLDKKIVSFPHNFTGVQQAS